MGLLEKLNKPVIRNGIITLTTSLAILLYSNKVISEGNIYRVTYDRDRDILLVEGRNDDNDFLEEKLRYPGGKLDRNVWPLSDAGKIDMLVRIVNENGERALTYTVNLWDRLVYGIECRRGSDGQQCSECDEYGYHLEGKKGSESMSVPRPD